MAPSRNTDGRLVPGPQCLVCCRFLEPRACGRLVRPHVAKILTEIFRVFAKHMQCSSSKKRTYDFDFLREFFPFCPACKSVIIKVYKLDEQTLISRRRIQFIVDNLCSKILQSLTEEEREILKDGRCASPALSGDNKEGNNNRSYEKKIRHYRFVIFDRFTPTLKVHKLNVNGEVEVEEEEGKTRDQSTSLIQANSKRSSPPVLDGGVKCLVCRSYVELFDYPCKKAGVSRILSLLFHVFSKYIKWDIRRKFQFNFKFEFFPFCKQCRSALVRVYKLDETLGVLTTEIHKLAKEITGVVVKTEETHDFVLTNKNGFLGAKLEYNAGKLEYYRRRIAQHPGGYKRWLHEANNNFVPTAKEESGSESENSDYSTGSSSSSPNSGSSTEEDSDGSSYSTEGRRRKERRKRGRPRRAAAAAAVVGAEALKRPRLLEGAPRPKPQFVDSIRQTGQRTYIVNNKYPFLLKTSTEWTCLTCHNSYSTSISLKSHIEIGCTATSNSWTCLTCRNSYSSSVTLESHVLYGCPKSPFKTPASPACWSWMCPACKGTCYTPAAARLHKSHGCKKPISVEKPSFNWTCPKCKQSYKSLVSAQWHMTKGCSPEVPPEYIVELRGQQGFVIIKLPGGNYKCTQCDFFATNTDTITDHVLAAHSKNKSGILEPGPQAALQNSLKTRNAAAGGGTPNSSTLAGSSFSPLANNFHRAPAPTSALLISAPPQDRRVAPAASQNRPAASACSSSWTGVRQGKSNYPEMQHVSPRQPLAQIPGLKRLNLQKCFTCKKEFSNDADLLIHQAAECGFPGVEADMSLQKSLFRRPETGLKPRKNLQVELNQMHDSEIRDLEPESAEADSTSSNKTIPISTEKQQLSASDKEAAALLKTFSSQRGEGVLFFSALLKDRVQPAGVSTYMFDKKYLFSRDKNSWLCMTCGSRFEKKFQIAHHLLNECKGICSSATIQQIRPSQQNHVMKEKPSTVVPSPLTPAPKLTGFRHKELYFKEVTSGLFQCCVCPYTCISPQYLVYRHYVPLHSKAGTGAPKTLTTSPKTKQTTVQIGARQLLELKECSGFISKGQFFPETSPGVYKCSKCPFVTPWKQQLVYRHFIPTHSKHQTGPRSQTEKRTGQQPLQSMGRLNKEGSTTQAAGKDDIVVTYEGEHAKASETTRRNNREQIDKKVKKVSDTKFEFRGCYFEKVCRYKLKCENCSYSASLRKVMLEHVQTHQGDDPSLDQRTQEVSEPGGGTAAMPKKRGFKYEETGDYKHQCCHCEFSAQSLMNILLHLGDNHAQSAVKTTADSSTKTLSTSKH